MVTLKAIIPQSLAFDPKKLARAVTNGMDAAAKGAQVDMRVTVQTWDHRVEFQIEAPDPAVREVTTGDAIYGYVDRGTRAHRIVARRAKRLRFRTGYRAKTAPGVIGSTSGGATGGVVFARAVHHPGTKARKLSKTVAAKWQKELPRTMQRAIDSEVR